MNIFENLVESYFLLLYGPEFLIKKDRKKLKNYKFTLYKESSNGIKPQNYNQGFKNINGTLERKYKFNKNIVESKSTENVRNFVYENFKLNNNYIKDGNIIILIPFIK